MLSATCDTERCTLLRAGAHLAGPAPARSSCPWRAPPPRTPPHGRTSSAARAHAASVSEGRVYLGRHTAGHYHRIHARPPRQRDAERSHVAGKCNGTRGGPHATGQRCAASVRTKALDLNASKRLAACCAVQRDGLDSCSKLHRLHAVRCFACECVAAIGMMSCAASMPSAPSSAHLSVRLREQKQRVRVSPVRQLLMRERQLHELRRIQLDEESCRFGVPSRCRSHRRWKDRSRHTVR